MTKAKADTLDHIRIYAHPDGTAAKPQWIVENHHQGSEDPDRYHARTGDELKGHILEHAHLEEDDEPEDDTPVDEMTQEQYVAARNRRKRGR